MAGKKKEDPGFFGGGGWLGIGLGRSDPNKAEPTAPPKAKAKPIQKSGINPNLAWVKSAQDQEAAAVKKSGGKFKKSEDSGINPNLAWVKSQRDRDTRAYGSGGGGGGGGGGGNGGSKAPIKVRNPTTLTAKTAVKTQPQTQITRQSAVASPGGNHDAGYTTSKSYGRDTSMGSSSAIKKRKTSTGSATHDTKGLKFFR